MELLNYKLELALQFSISCDSCEQRQRMQQQPPRRSTLQKQLEFLKVWGHELYILFTGLIRYL